MQDVAKFNVSAHEVGLKRNILPVQWHIVQYNVQYSVKSKPFIQANKTLN